MACERYEYVHAGVEGRFNREPFLSSFGFFLMTKEEAPYLFLHSTFLSL